MARSFNGTTDKIDCGTGFVFTKSANEVVNGPDRFSHGMPFQLDNSDIIVGFDTNEDAGASFNFKLVRSTDGGVTWGSKVTILDTASNIFEGSFIQWGSGAGTLACVMGDGANVVVDTSTDRGATWTGSPTTITSSTTLDPHPSIAQRADGRFVVAYSINSQIAIKISTNANDVSAWGSEAIIETGTDLRDPSILKLANGNLIVAFLSEATAKPIKTIISTDDGATWGSATTIFSNVFSGSNDPNMYQRQDGTLILLFSNARGQTSPSDRWQYALVSKNSGESWDYCTYMYGDGDPHRCNGVQLANGTDIIVCSSLDGGDSDFHISRIEPPASWPRPNIANMIVYTSFSWMRYTGPNASGGIYAMSKNGVSKVQSYVVDDGGSNNNQPRAYITRSGSVTDYRATSGDIPDNSWVFLAVTCDFGLFSPDKIDFFKGTPGGLVVPLAKAQTEDGAGLMADDSGGSLVIGGRATDNNRGWQGDLAFSGIIGRVLNTAELQQVMEHSARVLYEEVAGQWPLLGAGAHVEDAAIGAFPGTAAGTGYAHSPESVSTFVDEALQDELASVGLTSFIFDNRAAMRPLLVR